MTRLCLTRLRETLQHGKFVAKDFGRSKAPSLKERVKRNLRLLHEAGWNLEGPPLHLGLTNGIFR
jgi:hypothetical protein